MDELAISPRIERQWLFVFDDTYCDRGVYRSDPANMALLANEMMRIIETGQTLSAQPCARALADLRRRLEGLAECELINRWATAMRAYLSYQVWEAAHRQRTSVPTVDEYLVARIRSGSMEVCAMALGINGSYSVPAHEMDRRDIRALTEMACCVVSLDNDLMSYSKEHTGNEPDLINLIDVFARAHSCSIEQAFEHAMPLRDAILHCYLATASLVVSAAPSAQLLRYVRGLSSWIRGNLDWSLSSNRYATDQYQTTILDTMPPPATIIDPPHGIAWWWRSTPTLEDTLVS